MNGILLFDTPARLGEELCLKPLVCLLKILNQLLQTAYYDV